MAELRIPEPSEKQCLFMADRHKYIGYGGARGGGKSWAVRVKAVLLCLRYAGIKVSCFDSRVQEIVRKRLRDRHGSEEALGRLRPVLEALGEKYGLESTAPEDIDAQALSELIRTPSGFGSGEEIRRHLEELAYQEAALKESFPEFSLEREMEDPEFLRLTAPHTGLTLADAYYALHREEIGAMAARRSLEALTRAVSYGGVRPREIAGNMAASSMTTDPRGMSKEEREALKKRIYEAKAQGVKLPYGG